MKMERESSSDSASTYQDGHEHKEERSDAMSGNEDHSEGIGMPIDSDEEECVKVRHRVVQVDPKEQEDFDQELKALLQESLESRKLEPRARLSAHMKISMNASEGSKGLVTTETADGENSYDDNGKSGGASKVCVRVLLKKGHKLQTKQMLVPGDCSLVNTKQEEAVAELEEKQNIKRIVLEYNEREEERNKESLQAGDGVQGGSSSITLAGRDNWESPNRSEGGRRHFYVAGGSYRGYGNGRR
jgi:regulator of nonsense transcripts 2